MKDKVFLDTNIFIYSVDASPHQKAKADIARELHVGGLTIRNPFISPSE